MELFLVAVSFMAVGWVLGGLTMYRWVHQTIDEWDREHPEDMRHGPHRGV